MSVCYHQESCVCTNIEILNTCDHVMYRRCLHKLSATTWWYFSDTVIYFFSVFYQLFERLLSAFGTSHSELLEMSVHGSYLYVLVTAADNIFLTVYDLIGNSGQPWAELLSMSFFKLNVISLELNLLFICGNSGKFLSMALLISSNIIWENDSWRVMTKVQNSNFNELLTT